MQNAKDYQALVDVLAARQASMRCGIPTEYIAEFEALAAQLNGLMRRIRDKNFRACVMASMNRLDLLVNISEDEWDRYATISANDVGGVRTPFACG